MAYYNRRDLLEHWVQRKQPADRKCTHACCRGYRSHPENWPVVLPARRLRGATDDELAAHFARTAYQDSPKSRRAEAQVLHEMERRDRRTRERHEHAAAVQATRGARRMEREAEEHRIRTEAEQRTQGYLVSREGQARGISDAEILTGRQAVFIRYASPEAKAYFADHPRPTGAYFRGQDTRVPYSDRPTRRRATRGRRSVEYAVGRHAS